MPERTNNVAVAGFIATNPGTTRFNASIWNCHPTNTKAPTASAKRLANDGHTWSKRGSRTSAGPVPGRDASDGASFAALSSVSMCIFFAELSRFYTHETDYVVAFYSLGKLALLDANLLASISSVPSPKWSEIPAGPPLSEYHKTRSFQREPRGQCATKISGDGVRSRLR